MFQAPIPSPPPEEFETRETVRKYLSLPVMLFWGTSSASGEIKNMSDCGGLVQCRKAPPADARVRLVRGDRQLEGTVVRNDGGLVGIRFDSPIVLRDWLQPISGTGEVVGLADRKAVTPSADTTTRLMQDLLLVSRLIDDLGQALAGDPVSAERHLGKIQNLDVAVQMLAAVCWQLRSDSLEQGGQRASAEGLRRTSREVLRQQA